MADCRDTPDLMSVLLPAAPPVPRDARVVTPAGASKPGEVKRGADKGNAAAPRAPRPDRRRAARALRNTSLWIAAGLK